MEKPETLKFFVTDSGIGIDDENIELIFDQFSKVTQDKSKIYRGLGLGLAIARNTVHLLDGEISVKSKIGVGTTFYFTLPIM